VKEKLLVGNCLETLKEIPDNSIDSVVTDPPYELGFMGKSWDSTGIAFNVKVWQECMRVLKPGGHLLAFSGSRTYHRMAVAIEDAGFEIRDQIMWVYGSGFPKSMDISKAIDKHAGAVREVIAIEVRYNEPSGIVGVGQGERELVERKITSPFTDEAKQWQGWGTALKPAHEPIVVARKPISEKTVAENVLTYGTGAINIDASRVGFVSEADKKESIDKNQHADFGTKPITNNTVYGDYSMIEPKNYQPTGRFPANLILSHNPDCQLIKEGSTEVSREVGSTPDMRGNNYGRSDKTIEIEMSTYKDTPEIYQCTEGCPFLEFPNSKSTGGRIGKKDMGSVTNVPAGEYEAGDPGYGDNGTAARFFYCAKTSKAERNAGLNEFQDVKGHSNYGSIQERSSNPSQKNFHPTVKPLTLIRYLIKLVTPPNGTVLDPFLGSGTTAVAATLDNYKWIGCELTEEYLPIINGRVAYAEAEVKKAKKKKETMPTLFEEEQDVL